MYRITRQTFLVSVVAVILSSLSIGCGDRPKAPARARQDVLAAEDYPQITVERRIRRTLAVSDIVEDPGPPLSVTVPVRSLRKKRDIHVQYRFMFLDASGVPLYRDPDWHYMKMSARTQVFMQGNALDANARDWRLEIRRAR